MEMAEASLEIRDWMSGDEPHSNRDRSLASSVGISLGGQIDG